MAEFKGKIRPDQFAELLYDTGKRYNTALVCPESNTFGYAVIMKMHDKGYKNLYYQNPKDKYDSLYGADPKLHKIGFSTQGHSRNQILTKLEEVLRKQTVVIRSSRCIDELKTFVYNGARVQAMKGKNDDLVMSLAIGIWLYEQSEQKQEGTHSIADAMLAAFAINKSNPQDAAIQETFQPPPKNVATNSSFISSASAYNRYTQQGDTEIFKWLIKR